jgi:SagB-type dehydrogenase family enzyme
VRRRSHRGFADRPPSTEQLSQLCWAAQGITDTALGLRTAPSAGALFPIALMVVDRDGAWEYRADEHLLRRTVTGDMRPRLAAAALDQAFLASAPVCMVIAVEVTRTARVYGGRPERYCLLEAGHVAQNVLLQATALGLVGVPVGAFQDRDVMSAVGLQPGLAPMHLLPLGSPA